MVLFLCDHLFVTTLSHMQIFSYAIEEEMTLSRPFRILLAQIQRCRPLTARVTLFLPSLSIALPLNISFSLFFLFSSSSLTAALPVLPLPNFVHVSSCRSLDAASLRQSVNNTSVRGIAAWEWFPFYPSKQKKTTRCATKMKVAHMSQWQVKATFTANWCCLSVRPRYLAVSMHILF